VTDRIALVGSGASGVSNGTVGTRATRLRDVVRLLRRRDVTEHGKLRRKVTVVTFMGMAIACPLL
jgi:hypothetical protein